MHAHMCTCIHVHTHISTHVTHTCTNTTHAYSCGCNTPSFIPLTLLLNPSFPALQEKRRLAINNAKRQWETMQGSLLSRTGKMVRAPELYANHLGSLPSASDMFSSPFQHDDDAELVSVTRFVMG